MIFSWEYVLLSLKEKEVNTFPHIKTMYNVRVNVLSLVLNKIYNFIQVWNFTWAERKLSHYISDKVVTTTTNNIFCLFSLSLVWSDTIEVFRRLQVVLEYLQHVSKQTVLKVRSYNVLFIKTIQSSNKIWKCTWISSFTQKRILYGIYYLLHIVQSNHRDWQACIYTEVVAFI